MFQNLKAEMARRDLTAPMLARALGMCAKSMNNRLKGDSEFKLREMNEIAKLFPECTLDYLFKK